MFTKVALMITTALQRKLRQFLICVFLCGLLLGGCIARLGFLAPASLIDTRASATALFVVLLLPLLISYLLFFFSKPVWILPLCFFEAFSSSYFGCGILLLYGSSGWLIRLLLSFSNSLMLIVLCWYWLRHLEGNRFLLKRDTAICAAIALAIGAIDIMYISPFLALVLQG